MKWHVGTSGWSYPPWRGLFYPPSLPPRQWLSYYASHFNAVEINNTFYNIPTAERLGKWENIVPEGFTFALKASRLITHIKRLTDTDDVLAQFIKPLKSHMKNAPLIFQLPPKLGKDLARLEKFLEILPRTHRCVIEFRDPDWHDEDTYQLLRRYNVAFCLYEKAANRSPRLSTADFSYVRLHGREPGYKGNYSPAILKDWHKWLKTEGGDAYVFFDNTAEKIDAIENARTFQSLACG